VDAELLDMSTGHKTLRIRLQRRDRPGNFVVACLDPIRIKAVTRWENASLQIARSILSETDVGFLVVDQSAEVEIQCGGIEVKENVKV
jgi:hypothetical protein